MYEYIAMTDQAKDFNQLALENEPLRLLIEGKKKAEQKQFKCKGCGIRRIEEAECDNEYNGLCFWCCKCVDCKKRSEED